MSVFDTLLAKAKQNIQRVARTPVSTALKAISPAYGVASNLVNSYQSAQRLNNTPIGPKGVTFNQAFQQTVPTVAQGFGRALSGQGVLPSAYSNTVGRYIGNFGSNLVGMGPSLVDKSKNVGQKLGDVTASAGAAISGLSGLSGLGGNLVQTGLGVGLQAGANKLAGVKTDYGKAFDQSQRLGYQAGAVSTITNPLLAQSLQRIKLAGAGARLGAAGLNVGQGVLIDRASGQETTPLSVGIDLGMGLIGGPNQFSGDVKTVGKVAKRISDEVYDSQEKAIARLSADPQLGGQAGVVRVGKNYRIIHPEDRSRMVALIDYYRSGEYKKQRDLRLEQDGFRIAQHYGIKDLKGLPSLVKKFDATLQDIKQVNPRNWTGQEGFVGELPDNTLIQEARKYKSAEEFIKYVPKEYENARAKLRYGSPNQFDIPSRLRATPATADRAKAGMQPIIVKESVDRSGNKYIEVVDGWHRLVSAKHAGLKQVPILQINDSGTPIKSQLTDIYNQANKQKSLLSQAGFVGELTTTNQPLRLGQPEIGKQRKSDDMVARERFDLPSLKKLSGGGSDRDVYDLGDGRVLKIAKTARGLAQNQLEGEPYAPVPKSLESGKNYVVVEKANPPDANTKKLVSELKKLNTWKLNDNRSPGHYDEVNKAVEILNKYGVDGDSVMNYDIMWNDLASIRNWGTDADGTPIHLDAGTFNSKLLKDYQGKKNLDDPDFRSIYYQSKSAKKAFGDTDPNSMYGVAAGIEPYYDEKEQKWKVRFNPTNAVLGMGAMMGAGYLKNINGKSVFEAPYKRGDISGLEKQLDEMLGTQSFYTGGGYKGMFAARQTAKQQLEEFASNGDQEAAKWLAKVSDLEEQIVRAQDARLGINQPVTTTKTQVTGEVANPLSEKGYMDSLMAEAPGVGKTQPPAPESVSLPAGQKQKSFLETVAESPRTTGKLKTKTKALDQGYVPETNKQQIRQADKLLAQNVDEAKRIIFSTDQSPENKTVLGIRLAKHYEKTKQIDQAIDVVEELDRQLRQNGRNIQAASLWNKLGPEAVLRSANRVAEKYGKQLDPATKEIIYKQMAKINKMPEGPEKTQKTLEVLSMVADKIPLKASELFDSYRYSNLLSSPRTHERNIYQNTFNTLITRPLDLAMEGVYDLARHPFDPVAREVSLADVPRYYKSVFTNINTALGAAKEGMKAGPDIRMDMQGDTAIEALRRANAPGVLTAIPKFMQAQDAFFSHLIASGEKARLLARGIDESQAQLQAKQLAEKYLLREKLGQAEGSYVTRALDSLGELAMKGRNLKVVGKAWSWFVPFVTTPINAAKQMVDHSLLGVPGTQLKREAISKIMGGAMVTAVGAQLAAQDRITWEAPNDEKAKELFYASGKKPFSIRIGENWVPIWYFGPYALALALPAAVKYYNEDSKEALTNDQIQKLGQVSGAIAKFIASQSSLQGVGAFFQMLDGDESNTISNTLGNMATQAIPGSSFLRYVSSIVDPIYRKGYDWKSSLQKTIPGMSFGLEPYTDPLGVPSRRLPQNYVLPYDVGQANPFYEPLEQERVRTIQQNKVESELKKQVETSGTPTTTQGKILFYEDGSVKTIDYGKVQNLPENTNVERAMKANKIEELVRKVYDSQLDQAQKEQVYKTFNVTPLQAESLFIKTQDTDVRAAYIADQIDKVKRGGDVETFKQAIIQALKDESLTSGVMDKLITQGVMSESDKAQLTKLGKQLRGTLKAKKPKRVKVKSMRLRKVKITSPKTATKLTKVKLPKFTPLKQLKTSKRA